MTAASSSPAVRACPSCAAEIPIEQTYVTWCDQCDWNVQPQEPPARGRLGGLYARLGRRLSRGLFERVVGLPVVRPTFSLSKALAFAAAVAVHSVTLLLFAAGAWLLIAGWPNLLPTVSALLILGVAWMSRPRLARAPEDLLARERYPALYGLVDRIAAELGARKVHGLVSDPQFNASFSQAGLGRKSVVTIGLPLFAILTSEEKVAILAHELAHGINGDPMRGLLVGSAVDALCAWSYLIRPAQIWQSKVGSLVELLASVLMIPVNLLLLALAQLLLLAAHGLVYLAFRTSQRAEYLADYLGATAAGTAAMLSALEKLYLNHSVKVAIQRAVLARDEAAAFAAIRRQVGLLPGRELERLRRANLRAEARIDVTHPPTAYRVAFLRAHPVEAPKVALDAAEIERVEAELRQLEAGAGRALIEAYRAGYYSG